MTAECQLCCSLYDCQLFSNKAYNYGETTSNVDSAPPEIVILISLCVLEKSDRNLLCLRMKRHRIQKNKDSLPRTCWVVFAPLRLESYPTDGRTDGRKDRRTHN